MYLGEYKIGKSTGQLLLPKNNTNSICTHM